MLISLLAARSVFELRRGTHALAPARALGPSAVFLTFLSALSALEALATCVARINSDENHKTLEATDRFVQSQRLMLEAGLSAGNRQRDRPASLFSLVGGLDSAVAMSRSVAIPMTCRERTRASTIATVSWPPVLGSWANQQPDALSKQQRSV
jgi:hypothetical protein